MQVFPFHPMPHAALDDGNDAGLEAAIAAE